VFSFGQIVWHGARWQRYFNDSLSSATSWDRLGFFVIIVDDYPLAANAFRTLLSGCASTQRHKGIATPPA